MSYEVSLEAILSSKGPELSGRLPKIREVIEPLMSYTQGKFPYYTPHNFNHSLSVEENLNWLIPDYVKEKMNKYEIFFIILSAWLHDWGMIAEQAEHPENVRDTHHIRTEQYLERYFDKVFLTEHEARIIGKICKGHRKIDLKTEEFDELNYSQGFEIRVRFLAALLRIADECDITFNRTPEVIYYSINPSGKSEEEFQKHLSITGVGQRDEKHKIYISAVARDPKGAKALREIEAKIQAELNKVKGILAEDEVPLDIVELQLETRGFVDKPIGFTVNQNKIVNLLMGDHLYKRNDVAVRELIQNSIDTCKMRETTQKGFIGQISVMKLGENKLVITDNGLGMSFQEAKAFLSSIGDSFYSQDANEEGNEKDYSPISQFGIGILSSFLIADSLQIETMKSGCDACKFSIERINEDWTYVNGYRTQPGTEITLMLNEDGKKINLEETIQSYFLCPEVSISYTDEDGILKELQPIWDAGMLLRRFSETDMPERKLDYSVFIDSHKEDYDIIGAITEFNGLDNLVLFNHGIFLGTMDIMGLSIDCRLFVNLKKKLVDINISRESIKDNEKYNDFLKSMLTDIFSFFYGQYEKGKENKLIADIRSISGTSHQIIGYSEQHDWTLEPFLSCLLKFAPILHIKNGQTELLKLEDLEEKSRIDVYKTILLKGELDLIIPWLNGEELYVNPIMYFRMVIQDQYYEILEYFAEINGIDLHQMDLRTILLKNSKEIEVTYPEIIQPGISFASFENNLHPLVVLKEKGIVGEKGYYTFGSSYWGNILVWREILGQGLYEEFKDFIREDSDDHLDKMEIYQKYSVFLDYNDEFVNTILSFREKVGTFNKNLAHDVKRYFLYLSYLPSIIHNYSGSIIALEVIVELEERIANQIGIEKPENIFIRMKPYTSMYLKYFEANDIFA